MRVPNVKRTGSCHHAQFIYLLKKKENNFKQVM
jgi:hypothetical protein